MKSKITLIILSLIFSLQGWSQGIPFSGVVNGANGAVLVNVTYVDSLMGTTGTITVESTPNGFSSTMPVNSAFSNSILMIACIENCQGMQVCDYQYWVPGTMVIFELEYCFGNLVDADGDGYDSSVDCNDNNQWVNPGEIEECGNGVDNDCDGLIDEDCLGGTCDANIYLVTDSMMNGTTTPFVVWVVNVTDPSTNAQYLWSTGDGGSMSGAFPTWQYSEVGTYELCLTMFCADGSSDSACVNFTVDANGGVFPGGTQQNGFTLNVVSSIPNSINEIDVVDVMNVYPNPANSSTTLQWNAAASEMNTIELYNVAGQKVSQQMVVSVAGLNQVEIDMQNLNAGIYQVVKRTSSGVQTLTLMK